MPSCVRTMGGSSFFKVPNVCWWFMQNHRNPHYFFVWGWGLAPKWRLLNMGLPSFGGRGTKADNPLNPCFEKPPSDITQLPMPVDSLSGNELVQGRPGIKRHPCLLLWMVRETSFLRAPHVSWPMKHRRISEVLHPNGCSCARLRPGTRGGKASSVSAIILFGLTPSRVNATRKHHPNGKNHF